MMKLHEYPEIGEKLYSTVLPNGLEIRVIPKKDFSTCYAAFMTNYGGAHRRFTVDGRTVDTPAGVAHYLEHKMFDLPNGDNALSILSANGADPNAFTSSGVTCYYFQCTEGFEENLRYEYSPESFTGTEMEFALDICNAVLDVWKPTPERKVIINLPSTVEMSSSSMFRVISR